MNKLLIAIGLLFSFNCIASEKSIHYLDCFNYYDEFYELGACQASSYFYTNGSKTIVFDCYFKGNRNTTYFLEASESFVFANNKFKLISCKEYTGK